MPYKNPCPHSKRWWSPEVSALCRQQNRERNLYRRTHSPIDLAALEERAREYSKGITRAQKAKWKEYVRRAAPKKAPGPYGILNRVIRKALPLMEHHLQALMQASLDIGYFPKAVFGILLCSRASSAQRSRHRGNFRML